jgi:hypothetical protein
VVTLAGVYVTAAFLAAVRLAGDAHAAVELDPVVMVDV